MHRPTTNRVKIKKKEEKTRQKPQMPHWFIKQSSKTSHYHFERHNTHFTYILTHKHRNRNRQPKTNVCYLSVKRRLKRTCNFRKKIKKLHKHHKLTNYLNNFVRKYIHGMAADWIRTRWTLIINHTKYYAKANYQCQDSDSSGLAEGRICYHTR